MSNEENLQLFEDQAIRTAWNEEEEEWYFSIVDVVGVLTESKDPPAYWRKLKQRLKEEGNETVTNCHALKLKAADGKHRLTDVANTLKEPDASGSFSLPSLLVKIFQRYQPNFTTLLCLKKPVRKPTLRENIVVVIVSFFESRCVFLN